MAAERPGKGFRGSIRRATVLPERYSLGPSRIRSRLTEMADCLRRWDAVPTIPATASALDRHPEIVREIAGVDVAIHGYRHVAYANRPRAEQAADLDRAVESFTRHGLRSHGFRAPYLRADGTTIELLQERRFLFDSSACRFLLPEGHPLAAEAMRLAALRYPGVTRGPLLPEARGALAEVPVALPDDEILVDGLGITNPATLAGVFSAMFQTAKASGSLLVLQVHPERFHLCFEAVTGVLKEATELGAWKATLSEVATWTLKRGGAGGWPDGRPMALSVTGDLDAVSLGDFPRRLWGEA
jgi:hypothetical protein